MIRVIIGFHSASSPMPGNAKDYEIIPPIKYICAPSLSFSTVMVERDEGVFLWGNRPSVLPCSC